MFVQRSNMSNQRVATHEEFVIEQNPGVGRCSLLCRDSPSRKTCKMQSAKFKQMKIYSNKNVHNFNSKKNIPNKPHGKLTF